MEIKMEKRSNERTFPAQDFIEDLVLFAEEFKGEPNLAYRKMNQDFEFYV